MNDLHRKRRAFARFQFEAEQLGAPAAGQRLDGREQLGPGLAQDIAELQTAVLALGDINAQPFGQGGVEIIDLLVGQRRKEPGRRMVEIGDDELQPAKGLLLPGPVDAHVLQAPQHEIALGLPGQRRHRDLQPLRRIGTGARRGGTGGKPDLARLRLAIKGRLRQLVDGFDKCRLPRIEQIKPHQPVHARRRRQVSGTAHCRRRRGIFRR